MQISGNEYSTALFSLAKSGESVAEYSNSLKIVDDIFCENPEYLTLLSMPNISYKEKEKLLDEAFDGNIHCDVLALLKILCRNSAVNEFSDIKADYDALADDERKTVTATVISVVELSDEQKELLKKELEKKLKCNVLLDCKTDESILGGVTVYVNGNLIDGSIKRKMLELKEVIDR